MAMNLWSTYQSEGNNYVREKRIDNFLMANAETAVTERYSLRSCSARMAFPWHLETTVTYSWANIVALRQTHCVRAYTAEALSVVPTETSICVDCTGQHLPSTRHHRCLRRQYCSRRGSAAKIRERLSQTAAM